MLTVKIYKNKRKDVRVFSCKSFDFNGGVLVVDEIKILIAGDEEVYVESLGGKTVFSYPPAVKS